jgi:disease resistance protein RPS2
MANKETEEEWKYAIEVLNRSPSELRGMEDVFSLLKFSYDNLETDALRSCFLYCSLFPEDYSIEKEQLIEYWIGEGFLGSFHTSYVYNQGHALIGSLKVACLLETGEEKTQVKMHDVVRSFDLWIASKCGSNNQFLVKASTGLTEAPRADHWKHSLRISLFDNGITTLAEIPECPRLSTLLLQWNSGLNRIPITFFHFMPALRVLDLSFTSLREIPVSINELVELRHLDLSGTKITSLPKELGDLAKLQHLDLQRTHSLRIIPQEAISGLLQLRILNVYYSYGVWEQQDNEVGFADLQSLKYLTTLGITINELNTLKRLYSFSGLLKVIQYLYIKQCDGLFYLQLSLNSSFGERLRRLSINNCYDLQYLQVDEEAGKKWLPSLEVVALHGLPNLETVWKNPVTRECLQNLQSINIWHCRKLRNVSWVLQLPKLEVIYLMYCEEMEEVVSRSGIPREDSKAFRSLRTLSIRNLPKLRSITPWELAFPSLESIAVIDCPNLKQLSIKTHNTSTLPTVYGNKEWWDELEWKEASSETAFVPHFMPI